MTRTPEEAFGSRLREERDRRGLSLAGFVKLLSQESGTAVDKSALARVERGERGIRLNEAIAIAEVLHLPLAELVGHDADERDAEIRRAQVELEGAELVLRAAVEDLERREAEVERARARLAELEHRDLADDLRAEQWPMGG